MRKLKLVAISLGLLFLMGTAVFAQSEADEVSLERIVVTSSKDFFSEGIYSAGMAVDIFTAEDIMRTGATSLVEFLKETSCLYVSDWYGTGIKANIDLMGFGDNALSNTLVLVNGRRINNIDLSGVDLTVVPLDAIERIEIIKGSGSVLYGDNAVGGVINIVTKEVKEEGLHYKLETKGGSYDYNKESLTLEAKVDDISLYVNSQHHSTDGYRRNSHYRGRATNFKLSSQLFEQTILKMDGSHQRYVYGLPAGLNETDLNSMSRRDSKYPNDNARVEDNYINLSLEQDIINNLKGIFDISFRNKNMLSNWLSYGADNWTTKTQTDTLSFRPHFSYKIDLFSLRHNFIAGLELEGHNFSADDYNLSDVNTGSTDIDRTSRGFFIQDNVDLTPHLSFDLGYRYQKEEFTFDYVGIAPSIDDDLKTREEAFETGLNYNFGNKGNVYLRFTRSFRIPKTDEYFSVWSTPPINQELLVQKAGTVTWGGNYKLCKELETSLDFFWMNLDNEIFYDDATWTNKNYPKSQRKGFDLSLNFNPADNIIIKTGYRYTETKFKKGDYAGRIVPAVPKSKFLLGIEYKLLKYLSVHLDNIYVGKQYLINDLVNQTDKLDSYFLTNFKIEFDYKNISIFGGINNLFDESYSEYASTNAAGTTRLYYPSPGRNFIAGCSLKF
jgi:iron complex outermembrane receptor protein